MGIASLDTAGPTSSNLLSTGAADIRALRTAIRESFVNFGIGTDVVTATAAQINNSVDAATVNSALATKADTTYVDAADALKAPLASPTFTGVPVAPTATLGTSTTQVATTEYVVNALTEIASYDTLYNAGEPLPIGAAAEIGGWDTATNATAKYSEVTGATDGRMTVATTGTYRIDFCANFATGGVEALVIELRKNGSALTCPAFTKVSLDATENAIDNASISVLVDASASEYFSLYSSGLTIDTAAMTNAHFTVQRVR